MSAADRREELEAAIRREATYMEPHTGRYKCAISEAALPAILAAADKYASASIAAALDNRARASRLTAAEASAAEHLEQLKAATGRTP